MFWCEHCQENTHGFHTCKVKPEYAVPDAPTTKTLRINVIEFNQGAVTYLAQWRDGSTLVELRKARDFLGFLIRMEEKGHD